MTMVHLPSIVYDDTDRRFPSPHQQLRADTSSNDDDVAFVERR